MKIEEFEYNSVHVEIWRNAVFGKYFWVTGTSPERFQGPCKYFASLNDCRDDVKRELDLHAKGRK